MQYIKCLIHLDKPIGMDLKWTLNSYGNFTINFSRSISEKTIENKSLNNNCFTTFDLRNKIIFTDVIAATLNE